MFHVYTITQYSDVVDSCSDVFHFFLTMQIVVTVLSSVTDKLELYHVSIISKRYCIPLSNFSRDLFEKSIIIKRGIKIVSFVIDENHFSDIF